MAAVSADDFSLGEPVWMKSELDERWHTGVITGVQRDILPSQRRVVYYTLTYQMDSGNRKAVRDFWDKRRLMCRNERNDSRARDDNDKLDQKKRQRSKDGALSERTNLTKAVSFPSTMQKVHIPQKLPPANVQNLLPPPASSCRPSTHHSHALIGGTGANKTPIAPANFVKNSQKKRTEATTEGASLQERLVRLAATQTAKSQGAMTAKENSAVQSITPGWSLSAPSSFHRFPLPTHPPVAPFAPHVHPGPVTMYLRLPAFAGALPRPVIAPPTPFSSFRPALPAFSVPFVHHPVFPSRPPHRPLLPFLPPRLSLPFLPPRLSLPFLPPRLSLPFAQSEIDTVPKGAAMALVVQPKLGKKGRKRQRKAEEEARQVLSLPSVADVQKLGQKDAKTTEKTAPPLPNVPIVEARRSERATAAVKDVRVRQMSPVTAHQYIQLQRHLNDKKERLQEECARPENALNEELKAKLDSVERQLEETRRQLVEKMRSRKKKDAGKAQDKKMVPRIKRKDKRPALTAQGPSKTYHVRSGEQPIVDVDSLTARTFTLDNEQVKTGIGLSLEEGASRAFHRLFSSSPPSKGLTTTSSVLKLICPYTKQRLVRPVRSKDCQHVECFGLAQHCIVNSGPKAKFRCPLCSVTATLDDFVQDDFVLDLMDFAKDECSVELSRGDNCLLARRFVEVKEKDVIVVDMEFDDDDDSDCIIID